MLIAHICNGSSASESSRKIDIASKKERVWEREPVSKRAKKSEVVRCQIKSKYKTAKKHCILKLVLILYIVLVLENEIFPRVAGR